MSESKFIVLLKIYEALCFSVEFTRLHSKMFLGTWSNNLGDTGLNEAGLVNCYRIS